MPALVPVPGVVRVTCTGTAAGQQVVNVFHVRAGAGSLSSGAVAAATTGVGTAYATHLMPRLNINYSGGTFYGVDLTSDDGAEASGSLGGGGSGSATNVPNSAAVCITWKIGRHYRGGHPRTYLGPIATASIEGPTSLAAAFVTSTRTGALGFLTAVNATTAGGFTCQLVCLHRVREGVQLDPVLVSPIIGADVDDRIDSQRRRLGRDR